jgi:uncharacterized membrane protein YcfT
METNLAITLHHDGRGDFCAALEQKMATVVNDEKQRIAWLDYAKGICIILVVMMHSTLGVEKAASAQSWLHPFIEWARPFRMPDFFLISGLFLASRIDRPWRSYLDSKLLHFAYFYILWMSIQTLSKSYGTFQTDGLRGVAEAYALGFVEPFGTLWFIYILAIFFVAAKLVKNLPPLLVFAIAAVLESAPIDTGHLLIDEFASRFVYFFAGYWLAKYIFDLATLISKRNITTIFAGLIIWGVCNYLMVHKGYAILPGMSLVMGFIGATAVISAGVVLSKTRIASAIRYCGENSIVIYLSFFLFMAGTRSVILKFMPNLDLGLTALMVTLAGVSGPILLFWLTRRNKFSFLFERPDWAKLANLTKRWHSENYDKQRNSEARRPSLSD